jgi:hypothetical protein
MTVPAWPVVTDPSTSTAVPVLASYAALPLKSHCAVCVPVNAERLVPQSPVEQAVPVHAPAWHVAESVQGTLLVQLAPSFPVGFEHVPVAGLHIPATWHVSSGVHVFEVIAVQTPLWQEAVSVQRFVSVHAVLSDFGVRAQDLVLGLHAPRVWHWSAAAQAFPQPPQLAAVVRSVSQPSEGSPLQSPNPVLHWPIAHACPLQVAVAFGVLQAVQVVAPQP